MIVLCNAVKDSKIVFCIICYPQVPTIYVGCNLYLVFNLSSILVPIIPDDKGMFYQKDFFLTKKVLKLREKNKKTERSLKSNKLL